MLVVIHCVLELRYHLWVPFQGVDRILYFFEGGEKNSSFYNYSRKERTSVKQLIPMNLGDYTRLI